MAQRYKKKPPLLGGGFGNNFLDYIS